MSDISLPLKPEQVSLLKLTDQLNETELKELRQLIIAYKAQRLAMLADQVWEEKGWSDETMDAFLKEHMRTPYKHGK